MRNTSILRLVTPAFAAVLMISAVMMIPSRAADAVATTGTGARLPKLKVSDNRRFLVTVDGQPFFYLADTAWELFHRLSRAEAEQYLRNRAERKYTVVQAVALAELDGLNAPNAHGDRPLTDNDPARPLVTPGADPDDATQYDYWDHVDYVIDLAERQGIYTALLPTWGDKFNKKWGQGPEVFTPANAEAYGRWLGERYKDRPVIWVLGGDRPIESGQHAAVVRATAKGIAVGASGAEDYDKVLMTFHPPGGATSATWFHADAWLDFNMQQNGHCANVEVWDRIPRELKLDPAKPVMDGEPLYEDHPICFKPKELGYSDDYEVRKFAWWNVFAGAFGHTYGNHSVWQMHAESRGKGVNGPLSFWHEAIERPGAAQMQHVRALIESRPFLIRVPDQSLLASDPGKGTDRVQATRGSDGSYAFVYSASGQPFTVKMDKLSGGKAKAWWYDPRTGGAKEVGSFPTSGTHEFAPPSKGRGNDWVLVLDDESKAFPTPGAAGR